MEGRKNVPPHAQTQSIRTSIHPYIPIQMEQEGKNVAPLGIPPPPFSGWEPVTEGNYNDSSVKIPKVTQGKAFGVGVVANNITFRNGVHLPC